jgi:phosphoribosyl 1,2-cyclic phosphodiesterase
MKAAGALAGEAPRSLSAILITHEHTDHVYGLLVLAKKLNVPVFMTAATHHAWSRAMRDANGERPVLEKLERFEAGYKFRVGDIEVMPFTIPHDAADPVGFTFCAEGVKVAFATDLGRLPENVKYNLRACNVLVLESNHEIEKLRNGSYPWSVKQRVGSPTGHLSNEKLADFLAEDYDGSASCIVLAHLSEENNHPEIARRTAEKALGSRQQTLWGPRIMVAAQAEPLPPIRL